jgi:chemotaxis signal transduction protein
VSAVPALLIPVGDDVYALPAAVVREVVPQPVPTRVPTAPAALLGLFNLRGEVVPMFDTAAVIGIGRIPVAVFAVVVATSAGLAGLVATATPRVVLLEDHVGPSELRGTLGIYLFADGVAVLLDVDALLVAEAGGTGSAESHRSAQ